jgi:hypothetical protein
MPWYNYIHAYKPDQYSIFTSPRVFGATRVHVQLLDFECKFYTGNYNVPFYVLPVCVLCTHSFKNHFKYFLIHV